MKVTKRYLVSFSVGIKFKDQIWCDIVPMDACHLLLGRPWQYDRGVKHDSRVNTYSFMFNNTKIILLPSKDFVPKPKAGEDSSLLTRAQFEGVIAEMKLFFVLVQGRRIQW